MGDKEEHAGRGPFRWEIVRGEPYHIAGHTLTPVARVISFGKARGTVGTDEVRGWGVGFGSVTPLAIIKETKDGERRIPIPDTTAATTQRMLGIALALTLLGTVIRWLIRRNQSD